MLHDEQLMFNDASSWPSKRRCFELVSEMMPLALKALDSHHLGSSWLKSLHPRRYSKFCFVALLSSSFLCLLWLVHLSLSQFGVSRSTSDVGTRPEIETDAKPVKTVEPLPEDLPPLYEQWYEFERHLPQQNRSLPYPEGANADFFYASNHVWGLGFNNALQEQLFLSHLAYIANRTYVFDVYAWNPIEEEPYTNYYGKWIPSRIPFTAFIAGPTVGGSFGKDDGAPRAVSKPYFEEMCPEPERTLIRSSEVNDDLGFRPDVNIMMEAWTTRLRETPSKCIEVGNSDQIFSYMVFGDAERIMPFFDAFLNSPVLKRFAWSSLVNDAVATNLHLFSDSPQLLERPLSPIHLLQDEDEPEAATPIPGLLAIHVRRGDFQEHCKNLARWRSNFMGWLQHPLLVDKLNIPPTSGSEQSDAVIEYYLEKCWPTIDQMVSRIGEVRWTPQGYGLRRVYIMTNGPTHWVAELKMAITKMGGWDSVVASEDLTLVPEQKYIAQAVDMAVAMRSQVFIGNGFSSLSSNVIVLRLSRHFNALANRLW